MASDLNIAETAFYFEARSWPELQAFFERTPQPANEMPEKFSSLRGECNVCGKEVEFEVLRPEGGAPINWRETVSCPSCGLIARWRASVHMFETLLDPAIGDRVYVTEELTALFKVLRDRHPGAVGSEFCEEAEAGAQFEVGPYTARHEDLTELSFDDGSFDHVLTFDVLEHIPDYRAALSECHRVLAPGGQILISVPFCFAEHTEVRARLSGGRIEHLVEPIYHGNPTQNNEILCYYHFGMDLLDELEKVGFGECRAVGFVSRRWGYFIFDVMFAGRKPQVFRQ